MNIVLSALAVVCGLCGSLVLLLAVGAMFNKRHPELQEAAEARPWDR
jgi:hypothetical protein